MAITKEYLDSISFDIAKQKYYNANKVDARIDEIKALVAELIDENEALRAGGAVSAAPSAAAVDTAAVLAEAKREAENITASAKQDAENMKFEAESLIGSARLEAEKIVVAAKQQAEDIIEKAKAKAAEMQAQPAAKEGFSARQLDAIDKINKQLDELNVTHATQVFRLKQALITMATNK